MAPEEVVATPGPLRVAPAAKPTAIPDRRVRVGGADRPRLASLMLLRRIFLNCVIEFE
jgi:hypothetical protein